MRRKLCRLCLKQLSGINFIKMEKVTLEVFDILLLGSINLDISQEHAICIDCTENLGKCFDFKAECLYTEDVIVPFVNPDRSSSLNLSEIYMKKEENANIIRIYEGQKICRLCLKLLTNMSFVAMYGQKEDVTLILDFIQKYIPEVNLAVTEKPVVCRMCLESLKNYSRFVEDCLNTENKIKAYCKAKGMDRKHQVKLNDILQFAVNWPITVTHADCTNDISKMEEAFSGVGEHDSAQIKRESLAELKCSQFDSTDQNFQIRTETEEDIVLNEVEDETDIKQCNVKRLVVMLEMLKPNDIVCKNENKNYKRNVPAKYAEGKFEKYSCEICGYKTKYRISFINHDLVHKDPSEIAWLQCQLCSYKGKRKEDLKKHMFTHTTLSEQEIYKCEKCTYQTNRPDYFRRHIIVHRNPSEIKWFYCHLCAYKGKRQAHLKSHILTHEKKKVIYKCGKCIYQAKNRSGLKQHMVRHTDLSELKMYSCEVCSYKTKYSNCLVQHMRKHGNEPGKYKCNMCVFATKYVESLKRHVRTHQDPSNIPTYNCDQCPFKGIRKSQLSRHIILIHMDQSKLTVYKCNQCSYKTPFENDFKRHVFNHRDPSEVTMYSCKFCPYKSRHRKIINRHMLLHKDRSEVTMFKCEICAFETRYKRYLSQHMLKHEPSKKPLYCCYICPFTSNVRSNIIKHLRKHKQDI